MSTHDPFRTHLDTVIHLTHPLMMLATMPWRSVDEMSLAPPSRRKSEPDGVISEVDLFDQPVMQSGAINAAGRPHPSG